MIRAAPKKPSPPRPTDGAAWGDGTKFFPVTLSLDKALIARVDDKARALQLSRSAAIRVLLAEALK